MIVGCYSIDLYCDFGPHPVGYGFPHQFTGQTEAVCFREARKKGWRIYRKQGKAKCPRCVAALIKREE